MKKRVAIIGVGITPFKTRYLDKTYFELAYDATKLALEDANTNGAEITHKELQSTVYGIYNELFERQFMPDIFINSYIGMNNKPGTRIASGGATGGYTVRMAYAEVASGLSDLCLCLGVEKCNDCYDEVMAIEKGTKECAYCGGKYGRHYKGCKRHEMDRDIFLSP